jgi:hypothetical protein
MVNILDGYMQRQKYCLKTTMNFAFINTIRSILDMPTTVYCCRHSDWYGILFEIDLSPSTFEHPKLNYFALF